MDLIDQHLPAGTYFLEVESTGGAGDYALTATLTPASAPFQAIPVGSRQHLIPGSAILSPSAISTATVSPTSRPWTASTWASAMGLFRIPRSASDYPCDDTPSLSRRWSAATSTATASSTWPSHDYVSGTESPCLLGNGDGTFQAPSPIRRWTEHPRSPWWRVTSTATAGSTWPLATQTPTTSRCCWATATARSSPGTIAYAEAVTPGVCGGRLQRRRPARPGTRTAEQRTFPGYVSGAAGQRRRHLPAPADVRRGKRRPAFCWSCGTSTATAGSTWSSPPTAILRRHLGAAGQRRRHLPGRRATSPSGPGPASRGGGRLQRRRPARPGHRQRRQQRRVACCWATATAPSRHQRTFAVGSCPQSRGGGGLQRRRPARPGRRQLRAADDVSRAAGQRRRHLPGRAAHFAAGSRPVLRGGGGLQRRRPARPGRRQLQLPTTSSRAAGQRRRHLPGRAGASPVGVAQSPWRRGTSTATAGSTWPSPTATPTTCRVLLGNGDGTFQPPARFARRRRSHGPWRWGTSTATAGSTSPPPTRLPTTCRCCWATATAPSRPQRPFARRATSRAPWRWGTSTATAGSTSPSPTTATDDVSRAAGQRRRHLPAASASFAAGLQSLLRGGGGLQRRRPARPRHRQLRQRRRVACCWATATAPSSTAAASPSGSSPAPWRWGTSTATAGSTSSPPTTVSDDVSRAAGQRRRHLPARAPVRRGQPRHFGGGGDFNGDGRPDLVTAND